MDRVYLRPQFSLHLRNARRVRWATEARADYAILFPLKGRLRVEGGSSNKIGTDIEALGALLLEPPRTASVSGTDATYLLLTLSPSYILDCAARTHLVSTQAEVTFSSNVIAEDQRLARLARDMADELLHAEAGQEVILSALVEHAVIHILRRHANVRRADELELSRAGLVDRRIRRAVELMHTHMDEDLPLEELAAAAHLSAFHFSRLFKKLTGASPHAYLATLRARRAQTLLAETDISITEVGSRVGYSSPSHFTKAFRQATGLTPSAFRAALVRG